MSAVYTARGIAAQMGVTYRELDYWHSKGYVTSSRIDHGAKANPGTGNHRVWAGREIAEAVMFAKLVRAGFKPGEIGSKHKQLADGQKVYMPGNLVLSVGEVSR